MQRSQAPAEDARKALGEGDPWRAIELSRARLEQVPADAAAAGVLGRGLIAAGDPHAAMAALKRALELDPGRPEHHTWMGDLFRRAGHPAEACRYYQRALALESDDLPALEGLAAALLDLNRLDEAQAAADRALAIEPARPFALRSRYLIDRRRFPRWHFPMINDERRNGVFQQAIEAAVTPDTVALDIGTGTGLLAMMAARAGAREVIACEVNSNLIALAREIAAANGFGDRIRFIGKASQQLRPGVDFETRPNLLISEIFDSAVIGEGALETIGHARRHLLAPEARIIPARAELRAALVSSPTLADEGRAGVAAGFDLSMLNRHRPDILGLSEGRFPLTRLSRDQTLFTFDFAADGGICPPAKRLMFTADRDATCHAIVYWMRLWLDETRVLDTAPDMDGDLPEPCGEHWGPLAKLIPPLELKRGMEVPIEAHHNGRFVALVVFDPADGRVWR